MRKLHLVDAFLQDLRYGVRLVWRNPGFAASSILTVALGIGATTAIFTLVYGIVFKPLPYPDPDRLVNIWSVAPRLGLPRAFVSAANYRDWAVQSQSFESLALVRHIANFNLSGSGEPERLQGARTTASLFPVLRVFPALGRAFTHEEEQIGRHLVVVLGDGLWARRFGRDPRIVGTTIVLNGERHEVIGVMPPGFAYPTREFDLWVPLTINPYEYSDRAPLNYLSVGRLRPNVTVAQAQSEMISISSRLGEQYVANRDLGALVESTAADLVRDVRRPLLTLLAAVASVLLIGCASLANLLIARAVARSGELVLRSALGAGRGRLVRQSVTELLPLLAAGGVLGVFLAYVLLMVATPWLPATMPRLEAVTIGLPVFLFAVALLGIIAILTAVWPAVQVARWDVASALRESLRGTSTTLRGSRVRDALVVVQIGVAVLLTVSAALLTRSFVNLRRVDPGFSAEGVATVQLSIPRAKYPEDHQLASLCGEIVNRVRRLPGVRAAGMVNRLPLGGVAQINMVALERAAVERSVIDSRTVTPEYFNALSIPLREGRFFTDADAADAAPVGIIDDRLARAAWPNESAIGRRLRISAPGLPWITIVGVVGHIRHDGLTVDPRPQVYWNYLQRPQDRMALVVRTDGDPSMLVQSVVAAIRAVNPDQPVFEVRTLMAVLDRATGQQWLTAAVLTTFAVVALIMSLVGVYGVVSYAVRLRAREFSIRIALGADRRDVLMVILRKGALLIAGGLIVGIAGSMIATRALTGLLHDVSSTDLISFVIAGGTLAIAALFAMVIPARRAIGAEPMMTLRGD